MRKMKRICFLSLAIAFLFAPDKALATTYRAGSVWGTQANYHLPDPVKITTANIDWASFLAQHDMFWTNFNTGYPSGYFSGAIMGNGLLGTDLYKQDASAYRLNVARTDVTEGRIQHPIPGYPTHSHLYDEARLPIGSFRIIPVGAVTADTARLSLYDALTRGIITTNRGRIDYRTYVHSQKNYIVWETSASTGEISYTWAFAPDRAISPRQNMGGTYANADYAQYPNPNVKNNVKDGGYTLCIQPLLTGWVYVVAWKEIRNGGNRRVIATVAYESSENAAIAAAKQTLDEAFATDNAALLKTHTDWWHNYYPSSFISFDNTHKMESFYWAQVYKFACASREGKPVVDIMGPWPVVSTPWPCIWMNLNTQLTYSWQAAANRSHLSQPLWKAFKDNKANLIDNAQNQGVNYYVDGSSQTLDTRSDNAVIAMARSSNYLLKTKLNPALYTNNQYEVANMTWLLYYYWQDCVYNNKEEELKGDFFELLTYAVNYYFHIRKKFASDGKYHLPVTASPEYNSSNIGADVNYDHSSLRWGLQTLIAINDKYNLESSKRNEWQDFLDNLAPYPTGAYGYKISATQEYASSHRHWSHLLQIYPYYLVNWDNPADRDIISKSIDRWQSMPSLLQGYSYSGSSAMYAGMGDGERAFSQLNLLIGNTTYIRPNTLYYESGNPVFETPMSAVSALHDMYLQSWGGKIRIFPAVTAAWENASFINLRTEGAFLVSAARNYGKTVFIQVESEAGGLCRLQTGIDMSQAVVRNLNGDQLSYNLADAATGLIELNMQKGDIVQVLNRAATVKYPEPVLQPRANTMKFGVNNGPAPVDWNWQLPSDAGTEILLPPANEIIAIGESINDYWIAGHPNPGNNEWTKATYFVGNLEFYKVSQKKSYLDYALQWANNNNWAVNGGVTTSNADNHASGQVYIDLYLMDDVKIPSKISAIKSAIDHWIGYYPESANWWWIDAMFMAMPTITRLGVASNDTKYFDKLYALFHNTRDTLVVYAGTSYWPQDYRNRYGVGPIVTCPTCGNESDGLYNKTDGLWWRDWGYQPNVPPKKDPYNSYKTDVPKQSPNGKNIYWSRGNGWVFAALARTLQCLPATDAHYHEYAGVFTKMAEALKNCQRSDGFWNMNLGDPDHYPAPETSGTGFFTFGLAWGINNGFLDRNTYYPTVAKAWNGLTAIAIQPNGNVGNIQGVGEFPRDPSVFTTAVDFGVGAVLLAAAEVAKLSGSDETAIRQPEGNHSSSISVYPNPVKAGQPFTVKTDDRFSDATVSVYTVGGLKVSEWKMSDNFDGQVIKQKGVYIVKVTGNGKRQACRVVVN